MDINEPRKLDEAQVRALGTRTLSLYPILHKVYDEEFIAKLIRRRVSTTNHLLLALSQPEHELFWKSTANDLECLLDEGALEHFRDDLRKKKEHDLQAVRSELGIAAWMKRRGFSIVLEPLTNNGSRCEFSAGTEPATWWEVKTPRDVGELTQPEITEDGFEKKINLRRDQDIDTEVRRLLKETVQPYWLDFEFDADFDRKNVAPAVKEIKRQLLAHHAAGGELHVTFEHLGLRVEIAALANSGVGGVAATLDRGIPLRTRKYGNDPSPYGGSRTRAAST